MLCAFLYQIFKVIQYFSVIFVVRVVKTLGFEKYEFKALGLITRVDVAHIVFFSYFDSYCVEITHSFRFVYASEYFPFSKMSSSTMIVMACANILFFFKLTLI